MMRTRKLVGLFSLVTFAASLAIAGTTFAALITFTFNGTGSGTVDGAPFTNADYTITLIGDTTAITNPSPGTFQLDTTATIVIGGIGTATVTELPGIFVSQNGSVLGFQCWGGTDVLDLDDAAFATYDLATPLGPISGLHAAALAQFKNVASTLGPITLSSSGPVTFQASLAAKTWTGSISIPWKITIALKDTNGDSKFKKLSSSSTGTIEMYISKSGPQPNAEGCYVKFSGDDGSTICIKQIVSISTDIPKSKTDQLLLVGTGTMAVVMEGTPLSGIAYLDSKGTLKKTGGEMSAITLSGKFGGGGGEGTDQTFVLSGNVKATLTEQAD